MRAFKDIYEDVADAVADVAALEDADAFDWHDTNYREEKLATELATAGVKTLAAFNELAAFNGMAALG
jgi:non-ribosomal peptide synthetase component E (peptide arylation enzyme)